MNTFKNLPFLIGFFVLIFFSCKKKKDERDFAKYEITGDWNYIFTQRAFYNDVSTWDDDFSHFVFTGKVSFFENKKYKIDGVKTDRPSLVVDAEGIWSFVNDNVIFHSNSLRSILYGNYNVSKSGDSIILYQEEKTNSYNNDNYYYKKRIALYRN